MSHTIKCLIVEMNPQHLSTDKSAIYTVRVLISGFNCDAAPAHSSESLGYFPRRVASNFEIVASFPPCN